jgi:hypothetical protein
MPWDLTGNTGTDPTTNFLGTTDDEPLVIRTNNTEALRLQASKGGVAGNVGIGTTDPAQPLHVTSTVDVGVRFERSADTKLLAIEYTTAGTELGYIGFSRNDGTGLAFAASANSLVIRTETQDLHFAGGPNIRMTMQNGGNVGIGTSTPHAPLEIQSGFDTEVLRFGHSARDFHAIVTSFHGGVPDLNYLGFNIEHSDNDARRVLTLRGDGNVGVGTMSPSALLDVAGDVRVSGDLFLANADCAEDFDTAEPGAMDPGTVMVIDSASMLRPSSCAYDRRVAGVVSGAGDLRPAIRLNHQSDARVNRVPIALMGRVVCKVDAHVGPIATGDLLTTSDTPGHAMKVANPDRALGAILGKAMAPFAEGRGLIPVLVALN